MSNSPEQPTLEDQPKPDNSWADKYGAALQPVALQFGQQVFEFTMQVGITQVAVERVMRRVRGNRELTQAMAVIANGCNNFAVLYMNEAKFVDSFVACKKAIESTTPSIMVPEKPHGIILPS